MRDYSVNIPKAINRLLPYYLRGRKTMLFLHAISSPLSFFNDDDTGFSPWAHTRLYELSMTAQKKRLEWHLNNVVAVDGEIELDDEITIEDEPYASAVCYYDREIQDRTIAPLFYANGIPTVTRLRSDASDKSKAKIITRLNYEHGCTSGRFVIRIPYSGEDTESVSKKINAGIMKFIPVGVTYRIQFIQNESESI